MLMHLTIGKYKFAIHRGTTLNGHPMWMFVEHSPGLRLAGVFVYVKTSAREEHLDEEYEDDELAWSQFVTDSWVDSPFEFDEDLDEYVFVCDLKESNHRAKLRDEAAKLQTKRDKLRAKAAWRWDKPWK